MYILYILFDLLLNLDVLAGIIYWIMLFFAPFSLLDCFVKIAGVHLGSELGFTEEISPSNLNFKLYLIESNHILPSDHVFHFGSNGIGANIVLMIVSGILFLSICLLLDHLVFEKLIYKIEKFISNKFNVFRKNLPVKTMVDNDVEDETQKIQKMTNSEMQQANLALIGLSKFYGRNLAVNQLYLGVNTSECFGLLVSECDQILNSFLKVNLGCQWCR